MMLLAQAVMKLLPGKNVLIVTHGECVRQAVVMMQPQSEVFEVKHTGYVVLKHQKSSDGDHEAAWKLTSGAGETGVMWFDD